MCFRSRTEEVPVGLMNPPILTSAEVWHNLEALVSPSRCMEIVFPPLGGPTMVSRKDPSLWGHLLNYLWFGCLDQGIFLRSVDGFIPDKIVGHFDVVLVC